MQRARIEQLDAFLDTLHVPVDADIDDVLAGREMIAHGMVIAFKRAVDMGMQVRGMSRLLWMLWCWRTWSSQRANTGLGVGFLVAPSASARRSGNNNSESGVPYL